MTEFEPQELNSIILHGDINDVKTGSLVVVGFPFNHAEADNHDEHNMIIETPTSFRNFLVRRPQFGKVVNMEFDQDISTLHILDIGDIVVTEPEVDTHNAEGQLTNQLTSTIQRIEQQKATAFVIGGSHDLVMSGTNRGMGRLASMHTVVHIVIGSRIGKNLLADLKENNTRTKVILFGAQGNTCVKEEIQYLKSHGGEVQWLGRDLRKLPRQYQIREHFQDLLNKEYDANASTVICVTIDTNVLAGAMLPHFFRVGSNSEGFQLYELHDIAHIAGSHPKVALLNVTDLSVSTALEESSVVAIIPDIFYFFALGLSSRTPPPSPPLPSISTSSS